jgi:hypothetical protein
MNYDFGKGFVLVGFCLFLWFSYIGMHNIDLAVNFSRVPGNSWSETIDCNMFRCQTLEHLYMSGMTWLEVAYFLGSLTIVFLIIEEREKK